MGYNSVAEMIGLSSFV